MEKSLWLRKLLVEYEGRLIRYATKFVPEQSAREIVQETFLRLWREEPSTLAGREGEWLFCVCRNLALDHLKKERNVASKPVEDSDAIDPQEPITSVIERRETESKVLREIGQLPQAQQEVMRLKFQEGFSYKEIAGITGLSVSHVGVLIHEAMTRLRRAFEVDQKPAQGGRQ